MRELVKHTGARGRKQEDGGCCLASTKRQRYMLTPERHLLVSPHLLSNLSSMERPEEEPLDPHSIATLLTYEWYSTEPRFRSLNSGRPHSMPPSRQSKPIQHTGMT